MQTKLLPYIVIGILVIAGVVGASYYYFVIKPPVEIPSPPPPAEQPAQPPAETPLPSPPEVTAPPSEEVPVDETANWKTYIDKEKGFQISYPSNYKIKQDSYWGIPATIITAPEREIAAKYSILEILFLSSDYLKNYEQQTRETYIDTILQRVAGHVSVINTTLGNSPAIRFTYEAETSDDKTFDTIYAEYKENGYSIYTEIVFPDEKATFDQILSTFRFLE